MGFQPGDTEDINESGKWNLAKDYSEKKIMRYLAEADEFELIASFGSRNFSEEMYNVVNSMPEDALKIRGFRRLIKTLQLLISNSMFALKTAGKTQFEEYQKDLKKIDSLTSSLYSNKINQVTRTSILKINEENYNKVLGFVLKIKENLNSSLLDAGLIYINRDNFDPKSIKDELKRRMIEEG